MCPGLRHTRKVPGVILHWRTASKTDSRNFRFYSATFQSKCSWEIGKERPIFIDHRPIVKGVDAGEVCRLTINVLRDASHCYGFSLSMNEQLLNMASWKAGIVILIYAHYAHSVSLLYLLFRRSYKPAKSGRYATRRDAMRSDPTKCASRCDATDPPIMDYSFSYRRLIIRRSGILLYISTTKFR